MSCQASSPKWIAPAAIRLLARIEAVFMLTMSAEYSGRLLSPIDRISELLFGLIMALTFTCTLGVATAENIQIRTMLIGALGCNLAWGIIDGAVFLIARLNERGRAIISWRAVRDAADVSQAQRIVADTLPLASVLTPAQLQLMQQ